MPLNVLDYLEAGAVLTQPDRVCFRDEGRVYTLGRIRGIACRIGAALVARADVINRPVAVCLPKCAETLIADLGIFHSGNFYLNIDLAAPAARLQALLANVDPIAYLTTTAHAKTLADLGLDPAKILLLDPLLAYDAPEADPAPLAARRAGVLDTDPACIINTSGSTGIPKSAVLSHRGLIDFMEWHQRVYPFTPDDVVGSLSPYHFDGYIVGFLSAIWIGAQLVVIPSQLAMFPQKLAGYLGEQGITFIFWVPTIMVNMANLDVFREGGPARLRHVGFAGEVFPVKHLNYWRAKLPHARFVNYYGPIEISVICTHYEVRRAFREEEALPIGFPCANTGILVLDEDNRPCPPGTPGELCVRGCSLAHGYWNNPEATARAFVQNPLNPHYPEAIYRTGDNVVVNEHGEIVFIGRKDFQIKHQGFRIELGEIENACLTLPGLRNTCVLYQRERKEITLYYESDAPIPPADLRAHLGKTLPKYMWPTVLHHLPEMPRNPNGKIDRKALSDRLG